MVDEQVHDGLGDLVGDTFANDVEVGRDQAADEFSFEGFPFGQDRRLGDGGVGLKG